MCPYRTDTDALRVQLPMHVGKALAAPALHALRPRCQAAVHPLASCCGRCCTLLLQLQQGCCIATRCIHRASIAKANAMLLLLSLIKWWAVEARRLAGVETMGACLGDLGPGLPAQHLPALSAEVLAARVAGHTAASLQGRAGGRAWACEESTHWSARMHAVKFI